MDGLSADKCALLKLIINVEEAFYGAEIHTLTDDGENLSLGFSR